MYYPQSRQIGVGANGNPIYIRDPIPNNNLSSLIDPVARNLLPFYPTPSNSNLALNYYATASPPTSSDEFNVRIDHNLLTSARLYGRFSRKGQTKEVQAPLYGATNPAGPGQSNPNNRYSVALGYNQSFTPTLMASLNFGFERWIEGNVRQGYPFQPSSLGLPAAIDANSPFFPDIQVSGFTELGNAMQRSFSNNVGTISADVTKVQGSHTLSFGYMGVLGQLNGGGLSPTVFSFNQAFTSGPDPTNPTPGTGDPFASFLLGTAASGSTGIDILPTNQKIYHGMYLQDDWKASRKLTLNLGIRYDIQLAPTERHNRMAYFDPAAVNPISALVGGNYLGELVYASSSNRELYGTKYDNFAPRVGFSYLARKNLVARGGFGIFFPNNYLGTPSGPGYSQATSYVSSLNGGITPASVLSNPFPNGIEPVTGNAQGGLTDVGQGFIDTAIYQRSSGYVEQWMFGLQYLPTHADVIKVDYIGNHGVKIVGDDANLNQLPPQYLSQGTGLIEPVTNPFFGQPAVAGSGCGLDQPTVPAFQLLLPMPQYCDHVGSQMPTHSSSAFNALQTTYTHRSKDLTLMASYTFSKFIDNGSGNEGWAFWYPSTVRNYYDLNAERSVDPWDVPSKLVLSYIYQLPVGKAKKFGSGFSKPLDAVLGGWQVSGIATFKSGWPLSIQGNVDPGSVFGGNQHVNVIGDPTQVAHRSIQEWFNTSAFEAAAPGTFGNAPRFFSNLRTAGYNGWDLAIEKWFRMERFRAELRGEMFNAFNHPIFAPPDTVLGDPAFGMVLDADIARQVQVALKIYW